MKSNTEIPNAFYRISVKALILNEKKEFLLAKEANGYWELLGGGLDFGEDPIDCLKREIFEESGIKVMKIARRLEYFLTAYHDKAETWISNILYKTELTELNLATSYECEELRFFNKETVKKVKVAPNVTKFIEVFNPDNHD